MAKKAKTSTGDELPASTVGALEPIVISPEPSPQRSPHSSPQCESITHFPLASVGVNIFIVDITELVGEERQQGEPSEAVPDVPSPSTTPPEGDSSAKASTGEPVRVEEEPASTGAGSHAPATSVAREGEAIARQLDTGKPFALEYLSFSRCFFCLLELDIDFVLFPFLIFKSSSYRAYGCRCRN
jgi:hypothetical protein